jgi:hypothetical protein
MNIGLRVNNNKREEEETYNLLRTGPGGAGLEPQGVWSSGKYEYDQKGQAIKR